MPIENERKYILPLDFDETRLAGWRRDLIRQAYLDDGPRIRQRNADHIFTYKKWVGQAKELVEIETAISKDDFDLLWPLCVESVRKIRYEKKTGDAEWVVDFLYDASDAVFVVMAEVEMPRHQAEPDFIPDEIRDFILYSVGAGDSRFTNKKLSDTDYAAKLYAEIAGMLTAP